MAEDPLKHPRGGDPAHPTRYSFRGFLEDTNVRLDSESDPLDEYRPFYIEDAQHSDGYYDATDPEEAAVKWDAMVGAHDARVREKALAPIRGWASEQAEERSDYDGVDYEESYACAAHDVLEMIDDEEPANPLVTARQAIAAMDDTQRKELAQEMLRSIAESDQTDFTEKWPVAAYPEDLPSPHVGFVWEDGEHPDLEVHYGPEEEDVIFASRDTIAGGVEITYPDDGRWDDPNLTEDQKKAIEGFAIAAYERGDARRTELDYFTFEALQPLMDNLAAQR